MLLQLADSHTHLNQINNLDELFSNNSYLKLLITIGTLLEDDFSLFLKHKEIYCTYGIHPNDYLKNPTGIYNDIDNNLDFIEKTLKTKIINTPKCVGIGETGLDFYYGKEDAIQYKLLNLQLSLAKELNKPVSIHARGCDLPLLIKLISSYRVPFVLHCYTYDLKNAMLAIEHGGYISFSGILTFGKKVQELEETAKYIPQNRILIETDAPYLAPVPYRGKSNHPNYLIEIAKYLAKLRNEDIQETADYTFRNTCELFKIPI